MRPAGCHGMRQVWARRGCGAAGAAEKEDGDVRARGWAVVGEAGVEAIGQAIEACWLVRSGSGSGPMVRTPGGTISTA